MQNRAGDPELFDIQETQAYQVSDRGGERCCMDTAKQTRCIAGVDIRSERTARMAGSDGINLATGSSGARLMTGGALVRFILADSETCRAGLVLEKYCPFFASVESPASARSSMRTAALARHNLAGLPFADRFTD